VKNYYWWVCLQKLFHLQITSVGSFVECVVQAVLHQQLAQVARVSGPAVGRVPLHHERKVKVPSGIVWRFKSWDRIPPGYKVVALSKNHERLHMCFRPLPLFITCKLREQCIWLFFCNSMLSLKT
jgi:hypothetical protein